MISRNDVLKVIYDCIDEVNESGWSSILKAEESVLFGSGSVLDSLDFVFLIVAVERKMRDQYDASISITSEKAMSKENSPFKTVGSLADFVLELLS